MEHNEANSIGNLLPNLSFLFTSENRIMKNLLIALVAVALMPSVSFAGGNNNGGGSKNNGTIKVVNNGSTDLLVVLRPSQTLKNQVSSGDPNALTTFNSQGGKRIAPGHSYTFRNVRSGSIEIGLLYLDDNGDPGVFGLETVTVSNRQNLVLNVSGDATDSPVIDQQ